VQHSNVSPVRRSALSVRRKQALVAAAVAAAVSIAGQSLQARGEVAWNNTDANKNGLQEAVIGGLSGGQLSLAEQIVANALILNTSAYTLSGSPFSLVSRNLTLGAALRTTITNIIDGNNSLAPQPGDTGLSSLAWNNPYSGITPVTLELTGTHRRLANRDLLPSSAAADNTSPIGADALTTPAPIAESIVGSSANSNQDPSFYFSQLTEGSLNFANAVQAGRNSNGAAPAGDGGATQTLKLGGDSQTVSSLGMIATAHDTSVASTNASPASLVITGNTVMMNGDITHVAGNGSQTSPLALPEGAIDLTGRNLAGANAIGSGTGSLNLDAGALQDSPQPSDGGAVLLKATQGNLILTPTLGNAYSGGTTTTGATLPANSSNIFVGSTDPGTVSLFNGGVLAGTGPILGITGQSQIARATSGAVAISTASGANSPDSAGSRSGRKNEVGVGSTDFSGATGVNWNMVSMSSLDLTSTSGQFSRQGFGGAMSAASFTPSQPVNTVSLAGAGIVRMNGGYYNGNVASTLASLQSALPAAFGLNTSGLAAPHNNFSVLTTFDAAANDIPISNYAALPEPGGLVLLGLGATALIARRRRLH
jgi:hypothetical protein